MFICRYYKVKKIFYFSAFRSNYFDVFFILDMNGLAALVIAAGA